MYSSAFIYEIKQYDDEFHALNAQIKLVAEATEGYLGSEVWQSPDGQRLNSTYYWENRDALKAFSMHPKHLEAKRQYARWYKGFHVVIAEIRQSYGDGYFQHLSSH